MTVTSRRRRTRLAVASAAFLFALPVGLAACSSDEKNDTASDVSIAVDSAIADLSEAADSAVDSIADDNADEGSAKDLAQQVKAKLDSMSEPGEPIIANINQATATIVTEPNKVSGLDDGDNDGKDDDAKFTIETNGGNDKACVQSQDGAWEVTDDEC